LAVASWLLGCSLSPLLSRFLVVTRAFVCPCLAVLLSFFLLSYLYFVRLLHVCSGGRRGRLWGEIRREPGMGGNNGILVKLQADCSWSFPRFPVVYVQFLFWRRWWLVGSVLYGSDVCLGWWMVVVVREKCSRPCSSLLTLVLFTFGFMLVLKCFLVTSRLVLMSV